jgi:hypothetical protein
MRKKAITGAGITATVLGGGLVLALNGGGSASAERTATAGQARPSVSASPAATTISRVEAERIALQAVPSGQVRSAELESEHGTTVWSVRVTRDGVTHDVRVDARTGKVVRSGQSGAAEDSAGREPERSDDRTAQTDNRRGEAEQLDDRTREAEHRHGGDDGPAGDHGRHGSGHSEKGDDHGGDRHGGDDG